MIQTASTSFIPKATLSKPAYKKTAGVGLLITISVAIFIISAAILAGAWFYIGTLEGNIQDLTGNLDRIKKEFEISSINAFSETAGSIELTKKMLGSHVAVSSVFDFLEQNTMKGVRFTRFDYSATDEKTLSLAGEAISFTALAQQTLVLKEAEFVKAVSLSNLSLRSDGNVGFSMALTLNPEFINYKP